ncbi:MAG: hypothetical protein ABJN84_02050 [Flavobacteriaceae bacterium]
MGTRELLTHLEKLEIGLSSFSYEELGTEEAGKLKKSFDSFKNGLEDRVFGVSEMRQLNVIYEQIGITRQTEPFLESESLIMNDNGLLLALINALEDTPLNKKQVDIVSAMKRTGERLVQKHSNKNNMSIKTQEIEKNLESLIATHKVDLTPVLEECVGQMELLEELIRLFKQNVAEFIGSLKINLGITNFRGVEFACQKIQPCLRMMKTVSLLEITDQMMAVCKTDNDLEYLQFLYDQFLVEYPKVEELVDFEIEVLRNI